MTHCFFLLLASLWSFSTHAFMEIALCKKDLVVRSEQKLHPFQQKMLKRYSEKTQPTVLSGEALDAHKKLYNVEKLRAQWSVRTGQEWPTYVKDNNKIFACQAHHVIPQKLGGPHKWWNIHPVPQSQHQGGIHGAGAPLLKLTNDMIKGVKNGL